MSLDDEAFPEEELPWWDRLARAISSAVEQTYEKDWMSEANCLVDSAGDTSFIRQPDELSERRWARICSKCDVFEQCVKWADQNDVRGVYIAGEWRD